MLVIEIKPPNESCGKMNFNDVLCEIFKCCTYAKQKEIDEAEVTLRRKHRRQSSVGISFRSDDQPSTHRRRSSYASSSWVRDADDEADELSTRRSRPGSWGPVGEFFYRDSLSFCESERSPASHHECNLKNKRRFSPAALASRKASEQLYKMNTCQRNKLTSNRFGFRS